MPNESPPPSAPEVQLLLACARVHPTAEDEAVIRQYLDGTFDWTLFARKAIEHGLGGIAGHTLNRLAPDLVPDDILIAFRVHNNRVRERNLSLFEELKRLLTALSKQGVDAIAFRAPILAFQAYDDAACREFLDIDFLIRDVDLAPTMTTLRELGYERSPQLSRTQSEMIQRLEGREITFNQSSEISLRPHTRLIPLKMSLDIDYTGLRRRAERTTVNGSAMMTLAPEDAFLHLAVHGSKDLWRRIIWACDVAAFIASHPDLDWSVIVKRARKQGCLRMVLVAAALARNHFKAAVPDTIVSAERADPTIAPLASRVLASWLEGDRVESLSFESVSMDRLRLHDGVLRRARYVTRTLFLRARARMTSLMGSKSLNSADICENAMQSGTPSSNTGPVAAGSPQPSQAQDRSGSSLGPLPQPQHTFDITASPSFTAWLAEMDSSLAVTSLASGMLFFIGADRAEGKLTVSKLPVQRPQGMAFDGQRLAVATKISIVTLTNAMTGRSDAGGNECVFVQRFSNRTGSIDTHDLAFDADGNIIFVNTRFSCLASTSPTHSFRPIWRPRFISQLAAEDRCHLNGLAVRDGRPAYVTAFSETDATEGWRNVSSQSGVVIDVETNEVVCRNLTKPHSPRLYQGNLWVLNSGTGEIGVVDLKAERFNPIAFCPGFLRGLDFAGPYALVGTSTIRSKTASVGLALLERLEAEKREARCGVHVIDTRSGQVLHELKIEGGPNELYDVVVLPKVRVPTAEIAGQEEIITIDV